MTKRSILFLLMALAVVGLVMGISGCSEEKAKEPAKKEAAPPKEAVEEPAEKPAPPEEAVEEPAEEPAPPEEAIEEPAEEAAPATEPAGGAEEESSQEPADVPAEPAEKSSEAQDAPAEVTIMATLWEEHSKGPVQFSHQKHGVDYGIACTECHHVFEEGKNVFKTGMPVQKCQECHNEPTQQGESKLIASLKIRNLKLAYHKNCQGCHRQVKKDTPEKNPPTICKGCHQPKEG